MNRDLKLQRSVRTVGQRPGRRPLSRRPLCRRPTGFTLVELLVVMMIIGILAALLIPVIARSVRTAKEATIVEEINQLSMAVEKYKADHGDYFPDFSDPMNTAPLVAHMRQAYSRISTADVLTWWNTVAGGRDPHDLDPAEAIVFWLSLLYKNPRNPLTGPGELVKTFPFEQTQFTDLDSDGWPEYTPKNAPGAPFVYFDGRLLNGVYRYSTSSYGGGSMGTARPYRSNQPIDSLDNGKTVPTTAPPSTVNRTQWIAPGKFQIISAGLDNHYGAYQTDTASGQIVFKTFPERNYYAVEDNDNLASFSDGKTLEDSVP